MGKAGAPVARPAPAPVTTGALAARNAAGEVVAEFPLRRTDVRAEVSGWLATTQVTQRFQNPFTEVVEAVYVFPLPTDAAVNDFVLEVRGRRVVGVVRERLEAERLYAEARARGFTASLLSQERPNVFTQSVANIEPGGAVDVHMTYFHTLAYEAGGYEYVFPMVVGPRYMPGSVAPSPASAADAGTIAGGGGTHADTTDVSDASRISPPVLPPGMRSGHDVGVAIEIDAGVRIEEVRSPSHDVEVRVDGARATAALRASDAIPNKDFVLRWRVAGESVQPGFVAHRTETHGGFFSACLVPAFAPGAADVTPREITFVLDTSGSMNGVPIETSKRLVRRALDQIRPTDRINLIRFAGSAGSLFEAPMEASAENVARAREYLGALRGSGGTEMLTGIRAWLAQPRDPRYVRVVVFLTDGYVGNEAQIHTLIRDQGQDARWFAFGIGAAVNRFLVEGIAELGNGQVEVVLPREGGAAERAAERLLSRFEAPSLVDVTFDAGELPIADVQPARLRDLFLGQPIVVTGRYTAAARGTVWFRGRVGGRETAIPLELDLPAEEFAHEAVASIWARTRIHALSKGALGTEGEVRRRFVTEITQLGLEFRLVSAYTSFLAVDESRIVGDGRPMRVLVPVELPQDVSHEGAIGPPPGGAARIVGWGAALAEGTDGVLTVLSVDENGPAAHAGLRQGERVVAVGGHMVHSLRHLEALLLQAAPGPLPLRLAASTAGDAASREVVLERP